LAAFPELKHVILVDEDVNIFDSNDVLWAMTTRYQGDVSTVFLPGVRCHRLDPSQSPEFNPALAADGVSCKTIFDCTVPYRMKERFGAPSSWRWIWRSTYNRGMRMAWWVEPAAFFGAVFAVALVLRYLLLRALQQSKALSGSFSATIRFPSFLWSLAAALAVALENAEIPSKYVARTSLWVGAFIIISLTLGGVLGRGPYVERIRPAPGHAARGGGPGAGADPGAGAGAGRGVAAPAFQPGDRALLAALGVGGIAVALALQDTLANLFAGIHILIERPIFVGDVIRLEGGQEGVVTDIGWRTTRLRTGSNDIVVVPNTKITSGILLNFSLRTTGPPAKCRSWCRTRRTRSRCGASRSKRPRAWTRAGRAGAVVPVSTRACCPRTCNASWCSRSRTAARWGASSRSSACACWPGPRRGRAAPGDSSIFPLTCLSLHSSK